MKRRRKYREFGSFASLMIGAMLLGNMILAIVAVVPLLFAILSLSQPTPGKITVERESYSIDAFKGDDASLVTKIRVEEGVGIVVIGDEVPNVPMTSGNNFHVFWKGKEPLEAETEYSVGCTRIGTGWIGPIKSECLHFSLFGASWSDTVDGNAEITVRPKPLNRKLLRNRRLRIPMPALTVNKLGTRTTDFLEIRQYLPGDSYRDINWKATVRAGRDEDNLLVNVYEREGNKSVWIFLDGRKHMGTGSTYDDAFEHGIQAAHALSHLYLARECRVGFSIVGTGKQVVPDVGGRQERAIDTELQAAVISNNGESLWQAMAKSRAYAFGQSPLIIVITVAGPWNHEELVTSTGRVESVYGRKSQAMIVHIDAHRVAVVDETGSMAADLLEMREKKMMNSLRRNAKFYLWDPTREDIISTTSGGKRR